MRGALARFLTRKTADHLRDDHVLDRGKFHQQVVKLIDEADLDAADARALRVREDGCRDLIDIDFAGVGLLEQTSDVQKRRLAGAGRRHQRNGLAGPDGELGTSEDFECDVALAIMPIDPVQE
jgi:hypothetical protein